MAERQAGERKPEGWRSRQKGTVGNERREARSRKQGRQGRNSGRRWDEGLDFHLGKRGSGFEVDLKETSNAGYRLRHGDMVGYQMRASQHARTAALQIKFIDPKTGEIVGDYTVIPTSVFDALRDNEES